MIRPDRHESVIDRATFDRAQAVLAEHRGPGKTGRGPYREGENPYILSRLVRCGRCGAVMNGLTNGKYNYYECGNRKYNGPDACAGTNVKESDVLHRIADHLHTDYLSLDGDALAVKASAKELTPGDVPKAFAKIKRLLQPPKRPAVDRGRLEKESKALGDKIDRARRNLVLLDAENVPTAQDEIRKLQSLKEALEAELRKRPPAEADVNADALELLSTLHWLGIIFRAAAEQSEDAGLTDVERHVKRSEQGALITLEAPALPLRPYLGRIAGITVHTEWRTEPRGRGRHRLLGGEITFRPIGLTGSNPNPDLAD